MFQIVPIQDLHTPVPEEVVDMGGVCDQIEVLPAEGLRGMNKC